MAQCNVYGKCDIGHAKTAEPIELPFVTGKNRVFDWHEHRL